MSPGSPLVNGCFRYFADCDAGSVLMLAAHAAWEYS
jgi:hypothetical protein